MLQLAVATGTTIFVAIARWEPIIKAANLQR
jgi:hypothetical protein